MSAPLQIPPQGTPLAGLDGGLNEPWRRFFNALVSRAGGITGGFHAQADNLDSLAALNATAGVVVQTGASTFTKRTIVGVAGRIVVTHGDGATGAPTVDLAAVAGVAGVHASPTSITVDGSGRITAIS